MGRSPCCSKVGLNRGAWSSAEDKILTEYIRTHGEGKWRSLPKRAGLKRCGKSCRLRWLNYLRPDIKRGNISLEEEELIIRLHKLLGNRWSLIAGRLPGRTDNEIKNYWNTNLGKKLKGKSTQTDQKKPPEIKQSVVEPSSNVIRTKAVRCTRLFIPPLLPPIVENADQTAFTEAAKVGDSIIQEVTEYESCETTSPTPQEGQSSNSFMDFNEGEIDLSELLNADLMEPCDGTHQINDNVICDGEQAFMFDDASWEDWITNDIFQPDIDLDLQSLASILESDEDWPQK